MQDIGVSNAPDSERSLDMKSSLDSTLSCSLQSEAERIRNDESECPSFPSVKPIVSRFLDRFFAVLGFDENPVAEHGITVKNSAAADLRLSMLSNFSTAYNVISISLSLRIMKNIYEDLLPSDSSLCSSALLAGMMVGQVVGGVLGDVLGRHRAMAVVMALQIVSSFGSACSVALPFASIFQVLAAWRFVLGLGCGGVYPLSATLTAESHTLSPTDRSKAVALAFSFQGVGYLTVPVIAWLLLTILGETSDAAWRLLLGLGAVPGAILTIVRLHTAKTYSKVPDTNTENNDPKVHDEEQQAHPIGRVVPVSVWTAIVMETDLIRKFLGTGGCWFLFDVLFYGNTLFQPVVLSEAFGSSETVQKAARDSIAIAVLSLPGYFASVYAVGRLSPRFIQMQGFFIIGMLYLCIGVLFKELSHARVALILVYGSTFFFSNFGPNATTFMLPSMTFSQACRSTLNGASAAFGKTGALLGASIFVMASGRFGQVVVFLSCALIAFIGCLLTLLCVSDRLGMMTKDQATLSQKKSDASPYEQHTLLPDDHLYTINRVKMKVVYSKPSLFDFDPSPEESTFAEADNNR